MVIGVDSHRDRTERNSVVAVSATYNAGFSAYVNFTEAAKDDDDVFGTVALLVKSTSVIRSFNDIVLTVCS